MITKEAIEAGIAAANERYLDFMIEDETAFDQAVEAGIRAALSTLPIAGEGKVKALDWMRSGWVEAFSQPDEFGFWYSIQPDKPVHGPGDPPFSCVVIWGVPGQTMRRYLGEDFQNVEAAKAAAQSDYKTRILSALISSPGKDGGQEVEAVSAAIDALVERAGYPTFRVGTSVERTCSQIDLKG